MDKGLFQKLVDIRRQIHANPEIGYQENDTAKLIAKELKELQIPFKTGIAGTGVVATLKKGDGPCIALRADMDALPILEETNLEFKSIKKMTGENGLQTPLMHACGHDVHTTMLLGAASLLKDADFKGTVKFIFQPSEEGVYDDPEKKSGGQRVVESGELDDVKAALGLHVHPLLPVGMLAYKLGQALACANFFKIQITGKMAHAAVAPHLGVDAILVASSLIQSISAIAAKYVPPHEPTVISFTKINGGIAPNVIADKVVIEGTVRALDLDTFNQILERIEKIIKGTEISFDAKITIEYNLNYPSLLNDKNVHSSMNETLTSIFGKERIMPIDAILGSEDFAFYSRKVPSMFYFLGAKDTAEKCYFLHDSKVVFNEECIPYGSKLLSEGALTLLK
ncbi:M20 metallopeptidase family protein [Aurantibacillus circumpalustris]|uniref:M20 metallopeptidase family protein n=1 Tax=Aurantibacillus circumpalustris TaxID=3036359 RepID=UPI00295B092E|nr:M20 family metallopeptidase [Aurantibacillus circumpalustris]